MHADFIKTSIVPVLKDRLKHLSSEHRALVVGAATRYLEDNPQVLDSAPEWVRASADKVVGVILATMLNAADNFSTRCDQTSKLCVKPPELSD